jgi:dipeptidyl aminopeptidase/acylaminoacyl peptidase
MMFRRLLIVSVWLAVAGASAGSQLRAQRAFTPEDALAVRSPRIADVTEDGRWIVLTAQTRRDRLNVDHQRFGDPTYIAPSLTRVMVLDARTEESYWLHGDPVQVRGLRWSADGARLAYYLREGDGYSLRIHDPSSRTTRGVDLRTGKAIASNAPLVWSPDGESVLVSLRPDGWAEEARTAFLDMTEGPVVVQDSRNDFLAWDRIRNLGNRSIPALVDLSSGAVRELLPETPMQGARFSEDGRFITYTRAMPERTAYERNQGTEYEIFRLDLRSGEATSVMPPTERRIDPSWNEAGDAFAYARKGDVYVRSLDADSAVVVTAGFRDPISAEDTTKLSYSVIDWSPDGEDLLLKSQRGWHLLDVDDDEMRLVFEVESDEDLRPKRDVQGWSEDGRTLFFSYSAPDHWERGLKRLDLETGGVESLLMDDALYRDWRISEDGATVVYRRSDGDRPDEVWVLGAGHEGPAKLTDLNPQLADVALARTELVDYLDADGNRLYGILYYPYGYEAGKKYPLVSEIYERFFDNGYNESLNLIASRGWFGFRPSVEFEEGYPGEAWIKGVTAGINKVIERGDIEEHKLGVHGTSYGGYATNLLITQTDRFAAAVNISGKVNIISFLGDSPKITTRNYRAAEIGQDRIGATLWEQPQKYIQTSAVMFADRIDTPLLMLTGEGDWNVPATNEREMYYALRRLGKEVVWVNYMNAGHGAGRAGTESDYLDHWSRMFDWYRTHFDAVDEKRPISDGGE